MKVKFIQEDGSWREEDLPDEDVSPPAYEDVEQETDTRSLRQSLVGLASLAVLCATLVGIVWTVVESIRGC